MKGFYLYFCNRYCI